MGLDALIQTRAKQKLSQGFSYPIGAKEISSMLSGVPDYEQCEIWFDDRAIYWASEHQKILKVGGDICVVKLQTGFPLLGSDFMIRVYAVPSQFSASTHEALASDFAEHLRKWFTIKGSNRPDFKILLNLSSGKCRISK